ncbi:hypothetical protein ACUND6_04765 [Serratia sp. IR-2025]
MSEIISSLITGVKDRTSGVYGYLTSSFIIFNWDNIYFIIFSDKSAEQKLASISLSFSFWLNLIAPISLGLILCAYTPSIATTIKSLQRKATWRNARLDFQNKYYALDLEHDRNLKIEEKEEKAKKLKDMINTLSSKLEDESEILKKVMEKHEKLKSEEYELAVSIKNKSDELKNIELDLITVQKEYGSYINLKSTYEDLIGSNSLKEHAIELKIDRLLGVIKGLIDAGYIPEQTENKINDVLEDIGYSIPTNNPLRSTPRDVKTARTIEEASKIISRHPQTISFTNRDVI